jgi:hypothetical protein
MGIPSRRACLHGTIAVLLGMIVFGNGTSQGGEPPVDYTWSAAEAAKSKLPARRAAAQDQMNLARARFVGAQGVIDTSNWVIEERACMGRANPIPTDEARRQRWLQEDRLRQDRQQDALRQQYRPR